MKTFFLSGIVLSSLLFVSCTPTTPQDIEIDTQPAEPTASEQVRETSRTGEASDLVTVTSPEANSEVSSPITLGGQAPGYWFFEASAPVDVVNWDGLIIGQGYVTAIDDWMTEDLVDFSGTLSYDLDEDSYSKNGWIIFKRDNPSALPENDAAVEIPVVFE